MMVHVPEDGQRRTLTVYLFQCTKEPSLGERWPGIPDGANAPKCDHLEAPVHQRGSSF
jgi:hypothetical protein